MAYVTQQAVLQEAGLWHRELAEEPAGLVNGSNTAFTVAHKPLADNNFNDVVDATDVVLYVNDSPVIVASVNTLTGVVTANVAPANGAEVRVDYSYTSVQTDFVEDVIEEASEMVDGALTDVATVPYTSTIPKTVRLITRVLAAGILLSREYGLQLDEEAVKQGDRKIKLAERWLAAYVIRLTASDTAGEGVVRSTSDRRIFQTYNESEGRWDPLSDESFTINGVT